ncbi:MAG: DNA polymerase III subunit, partial [Bacilli bacterium]|nr:DNA polymerase III subunit [Bacilli bacterium]
MSNEEIINSIINSFHENNNSHAFLVDTNNLDLCYQDIIKIVKTVNCKNGTIDDCNVCHTIDVGTNPDIITVKPEKKEIGVEPIDNIIKAFSTQPLISKYSMYIIYNADLMSVQAANTILKFLEEPEENIVGFFITDRINSILPTISSRCELVNIRYGSKTALDLLNITGEEFDNLFDKVKNIIDILSYETKYQMMNKSDEISKLEREDILKIFKITYILY